MRQWLPVSVDHHGQRGARNGKDTGVRRAQVAKITFVGPALGLKLYYKAHEYFVTVTTVPIKTLKTPTTIFSPSNI